ncbi:metal-dependent hydrolase [Corallococcus sp. H22C18031201]|uniref:metal-dependent hydrolase n=1 Tax=Citreicoccus inhibens TaxID=2849499 RepID=UPI000E7511CD|nr:metal-dependent hydrolase [Citreicoccus inhibens]MBU8898960.1 metal-dependent hydrolase [Citreicoccus inhibens]RJS18463.1 metal-dependent hydrolase [Corallococcus sp. H22C18031201]
MASIGHVAVGLALGRHEAGAASWRRRVTVMGFLASLALLPDADVIAFALRIPYAATWGHRGASHSFAFAALLALAVAIAARGLGESAARWGLVSFLALASHGVLDSLTDGGLGPALLWPFSNARMFAPVRPLPVSPIGAGMLSPRGLYVATVEFLVFLPCWAYALWPRTRPSRA